MAGNVPVRREPAKPPFQLEELRNYLQHAAGLITARPGFAEIGHSVVTLVANVEEHYRDLEELEQRLTAIEERMSAMIRASCSDEELFQLRRELDTTLRPYRSKMSAEQISMLERQYLDRRLQEKAGLPRLSLFYLA